MAKKAKTIKMLLYDGSLSGVMMINDSAWGIGQMYSAPRGSINDLISQVDCKRYGVYLLLSDQQVYIGQASDLERRTRQHLTDKDWWDRVILLTTKDDNFTASDINYLESCLIDSAMKVGKLDSDNKKRGNPRKVDEFRQAELDQYLEEALFILELIGVRVFKLDQSRSQQARNATGTVKAKTASTKSKASSSKPNAIVIPPLPDKSLKIGKYVYTAMQNLSASGYTFTADEIAEMTTPEWSTATFHTKNPFLKLYTQGQTDNKGQDGRVRFKSEPYTFGGFQVLISKEWYERQQDLFVTWYQSLTY